MTSSLIQPALKEWSAAVHAMLDGRQTVLLRKGGIHEKRFAVTASRLLLFPTVAHSHAERVRPEHRDLLDAAASDSNDDSLVIRAGAKVVAAVEVNQPDALDAIAPFHIWTAESVRDDRLDFRPKHRLTVMVVQASPLVEPLRPVRDGFELHLQRAEYFALAAVGLALSSAFFTFGTAISPERRGYL